MSNILLQEQITNEKKYCYDMYGSFGEEHIPFLEYLIDSLFATLDAAWAERDEARRMMADYFTERNSALARCERLLKECEEWSRADNGQQTWDYEAAAEARRLRAEREAKRG